MMGERGSEGPVCLTADDATLRAATGREQTYSGRCFPRSWSRCRSCPLLHLWLAVQIKSPPPAVLSKPVFVSTECDSTNSLVPHRLRTRALRVHCASATLAVTYPANNWLTRFTGNSSKSVIGCPKIWEAGFAIKLILIGRYQWLRFR